VALLHRVWNRGQRIGRRLARATWPGTGLILAGLLSSCSAGEGADSELAPDALLQRELGLVEADRVHTVRITGGDVETAEPALDSVAIGSYVQFVTEDWLVHEVIFEADSLSEDALAFLERTDQMASPPLLRRDSRFGVSFSGAPAGRYRYLMEGNGRPGSGVIVVVDHGSR
jgi:plastocyanin